MRFFCILMTLLLTGCGARLRPDLSLMDALDANYPAAEFVVAGKRHKGLAVIPVSPGQPLEGLAAQIQTYFRGSLRIDSRRCEIGESRVYTHTSLVPMGLRGAASQSCVITFVVTPELPRQVQSEEIVRGYRGHLLIKVVRPGDEWSGLAVKAPLKPSLVRQVVVGPSETVRWIATGCGLTVEKTLVADAQGSVAFDLADAIEAKKQTCVVEAAIFGSKSYFMTVLVSLYDQRFTPLPATQLVDDDIKNVVCASSDPSVTLISAQQERSVFYRVAHEGCLTFDHEKPGIFRALTVKGRSSIFEYMPGLGWLEVR